MSSQSATTLGFIAPYTVAFISGSMAAGWILFRQGWAAMRDHLSRNVILVVCAAIFADLIWYGPQFAYSILRTSYGDHENLSRQVLDLSKELPTNQPVKHSQFLAFDSAWQAGHFVHYVLTTNHDENPVSLQIDCANLVIKEATAHVMSENLGIGSEAHTPRLDMTLKHGDWTPQNPIFVEIRFLAPINNPMPPCGITANGIKSE